MLYLEDYLELIEHLPQELRDRLTRIRESDLKVNNSSLQIDAKVKQFFAEAKNLTPEQKQCEYEKILNDYNETIAYADEKVNSATQTNDIMVKLIQKLDTELEKFKLELEADHAGITEELERRSLELDNDTHLDDIINNHLNGSTSSQVFGNEHHYQVDSLSNHNHNNKVPLGIKDRRRSEHKHHRHHPYRNNNHDNGYPGRDRLSNQQYKGAGISSSSHLKHHHKHRHTGGGKHAQHLQGKSRQNSTTSSPTPYGPNMSSFSAPPSVAGDLSRLGLDGVGSGGYYSNNITSFGNNSGFKTSYNNTSNKISNLPYSHQHSALSAALSSLTPTTPLNSVSALAMMNSTSSVQNNKISNQTNNLNKSNHDLIDSNNPLVRQNPLAAAASQAIAATQQLQQGRRTLSLKASFAAINAAGLTGQLESLSHSANNNKQDATSLAGGNNRNALAPMAPDQQSFRANHQFGGAGRVGDGSNGHSSPLFNHASSVTKSGRPTKRPKHHASHLYPDESPTSFESDNSVFENSESLSSADFIETGTNFGSTSPSSLDFNSLDRSSSGHVVNSAGIYQRDETKYCTCRQISYGEMVACDNEECEIEWFHYDCVGITQPPKGKWFCPRCTRKMNSHHDNGHAQSHKKRGRKEKSVFNLVNNSIPDSSVVRSKDGRPTNEQSKVIVGS